MLVKFKQAVHLCKKDYARGVHNVSEQVLKDPFFHKLVQAGLVEDEAEVKLVSPQTLKEKQAKFAEKIMKKYGKSSAATLPQKAGAVDASGGASGEQLSPPEDVKEGDLSEEEHLPVADDVGVPDMPIKADPPKGKGGGKGKGK